MEKREGDYKECFSEDSQGYTALDFFTDERWPNELGLLVVQHLSPTDLIVCRVICKKWRFSLNNELYWKSKIPSSFSAYFSEFKGDYYQIFTRGGVHLIQTLEHLKKYQVDDDLMLAYLNSAHLYPSRINPDLGFIYSKTKKIEYVAMNDVDDVRGFVNEAMKFDCPYLVLPTKYFEDEKCFYIVFDNQFQELSVYLNSIPVEEYNEKLVVKLVRQLIHAIKYLHERNLCLISSLGGVDLCIKRNYDGEIQLQVLSCAVNIGTITSHVCRFISPERASNVNGPPILQADLFSLGSLTFYLLSGSHLCQEENLRRFLGYMWLFKGYDFKAADNEVSDLAKDFVQRLLQRKPEDRMTLEEASNHPWLTNPHPGTTPLRTAYFNLAAKFDDFSDDEDE